MAQFAVEIVTIVAVVVILGILAAYISILKKNGWLGRSNKFYRCPNQECKKIFQEPIELKDLSEEPARIYPACPDCGVDLGPILHLSVEKKIGSTTKTSPEQKEIEQRIEDAASKFKVKETRNIESSIDKSFGSANPDKTQIAVEGLRKSCDDAEAAKPTYGSRKKPNALLKAQQKSYLSRAHYSEVEDAMDFPESCLHFFGYLRSHPKGTMVPNECYSCHRIVDCYLQ